MLKIRPLTQGTKQSKLKALQRPSKGSLSLCREAVCVLLCLVCLALLYFPALQEPELRQPVSLSFPPSLERGKGQLRSHLPLALDLGKAPSAF